MAVDTGRAVELALFTTAAFALVAMVIVVGPAVFFRDATRRRDARKVLRLLIGLIRRRG